MFLEKCLPTQNYNFLKTNRVENVVMHGHVNFSNITNIIESYIKKINLIHINFHEKHF